MSHTQGWVRERQLLSIKTVRLSCKSEAAVTGKAGWFVMYTFSPVSSSRKKFCALTCVEKLQD